MAKLSVEYLISATSPDECSPAKALACFVAIFAMVSNFLEFDSVLSNSGKHVALVACSRTDVVEERVAN